MATTITDKFLNQDKRETEALTVTLPAVLDEGGGRTNSLPTYVQVAEEFVAAVSPKEAVLGKSYLVVEEAFPAGMTVTVSINGTAIFTDVSVAAIGLTTSATEDVLLLTSGNVSITINHATVTGDVAVGKLKVVNNYTPYTVKNGRYSNAPTV